MHFHLSRWNPNICCQIKQRQGPVSGQMVWLSCIHTTQHLVFIFPWASVTLSHAYHPYMFFFQLSVSRLQRNLCCSLPVFHCLIVGDFWGLWVYPVCGHMAVLEDASLAGYWWRTVQDRIATLDIAHEWGHESPLTHPVAQILPRHFFRKFWCQNYDWEHDNI